MISTDDLFMQPNKFMLSISVQHCQADIKDTQKDVRSVFHSACHLACVSPRTCARQLINVEYQMCSAGLPR